jgi:two-component system sensor histidine kinase PhoQ
MQLFILKWGLAPLARFTRDLERMRAGTLAQLPDGEVQELKPLAGLLNQLVTRERAQSERYRQSLADLAHSLKTPVTILRNEWTRRFRVGEAEGSESDLDDATLSQLDEIEQKITYQLERAVLQSSPLVQVPIAVEPVVQGLIRAMNKMFREKTVVWDIDLSQTLIRVDPRDLNEILGNLVENAVKYGAQTIRISLGQEGNDAVLEVQDNGPGIPLERRAEVMERGQRADTKAQGYGIGLDIVRQIAERHGAELEYRVSERLGGAAFSIRFEGLAQIPL